MSKLEGQLREFIHNGVTYRFDSVACAELGGLIRLPDGTLLRVNSWLEAYPPIPSGFSLVPVTDATIVGDAPAAWMPH